MLLIYSDTGKCDSASVEYIVPEKIDFLQGLTLKDGLFSHLEGTGSTLARKFLHHLLNCCVEVFFHCYIQNDGLSRHGDICL